MGKDSDEPKPVFQGRMQSKNCKSFAKMQKLRPQIRAKQLRLAILQITATREDGTIMGISNLDKNITGVQFHPEAALTEFGYELLANWLELCGDLGARNRAIGLSVLLKPVINS